ncbi:hypothetical protein NUU61_002626 [Penicillium alfredii]|uniref:Xaa-Pro dipeptidyl-peptidase-like domain-containing protein n=1 Tax=Penicillium alfredii TaxID=1506179 RepID=A0A9W9FRW3_9EURO|nr:uncharacterized protein NUU61_002626 [Penicillium alfredii]KAJ5105279.1 hypothetical protein NUU61_002626 [Penicillium alfredii]
MVRSENVMIPASGVDLRISATYLIPENAHPKPPLIIMGLGIGAVKAAGPLPFAERFVAAGYATLRFDYLFFGESEGKPANLMSIPRELQDFLDVVAWARQQDNQWDVNRLIVWGTSFGGMHITALMAEDHGLAAGIMQCPCVDGLAAVMKVSLWRTLRMLPFILGD